MSELVIWKMALGIATVLVVFLYFKDQRRLRRWEGRFDPAEWKGKAIDVTDLKPKLERVRRNHMAARPPRRGLCLHRALLQWARHTVVRLDYFRAKESDPVGMWGLPKEPRDRARAVAPPGEG